MSFLVGTECEMELICGWWISSVSLFLGCLLDRVVRHCKHVILLFPKEGYGR